MQFTWQGCDSILAAPLVIDLVRLVDRARLAGERGQLPWLASFFKSPLGCTEQGFAAQVSLLTDWVKRQTNAG
jgi:myo-inositol-1-phosphate synthase